MSSNPFVIRAATEADFEQLCDLIAELDDLHRDAHPDLFVKPQGLPRQYADIARLIAGPDSTILVAADRESRCLYGFATLIIRCLPESPVRPARRLVEIDNFCVSRSARRRGIGRALVEHSDHWAARRGLSSVELAVWEFNTGAIGFYEAVGFSAFLRRMVRHPAS
jgi:ribosomal protein S18 acetylase RimI-like enzyme